MVSFTVGRGPNATTAYIGWAPVPAQLTFGDEGDAAIPAVGLRNRRSAAGGQVVFADQRGGPYSDTFRAELPSNGQPVHLFIAGRFGRASTVDRDAAVVISDEASGREIARTKLMVRVRKDASTLTNGERDRFLVALAKLNEGGLGAYSVYPNVHTVAGSPEAHDNPGFLPWHRAFLLDLERELQAIDPSVALHYWRFDAPARKVFRRSFMGTPTASGALAFSSTNPLQFWATPSGQGIIRRPLFDVATETPDVLGEEDTLALGGDGDEYTPFRDLEMNPHGSAHVGFTGLIRSIGTAAADPLFFMLHANVDRLWAKWQWAFDRFDASNAATFFPPGMFGPGSPVRVGHNLEDTMWPWNQMTGGDRPMNAPGGPFPSSALADAPGATPRVGDLIDYQGVLKSADRLGFDYDDVPFQP